MRKLIGSRFVLTHRPLLAPASLLALCALVPSALGCGIGHSLANESDDGGTSGPTGSHEAGGSTPIAPPPIGPGVPPDPGGPAPASPGQLAFAIHRVYLGDTDANSVSSPSAWKSYGLDIDGVTTTKDSVNVCKRAVGASKGMQIDGNGGIDNSFGQNILPIIITTAGSDITQQVNADIYVGKLGTTLITVRGIGSGSAYSPLAGAFFATLAPEAPPAWDESDGFLIDSRSVIAGNIDTPRVTFAHGYFSQDTFVSDVIAQATVKLPFLGFSDDDPTDVTHLRVVMTLSADHRTVTHGILSGVLPTESFIVHMKQMAGRISSSLCSGAAFESIAQQIRNAQDILSDGSQDPSRECDGISFGIGFDARVVGIGSVETPTPPPVGCGPN